MIAESLASRRPHTGKVFFVAGTANANWEELTEMFPPGPEGKTRVYSTLQGALDDTSANADDVIFVAPNFTLTITAADGLRVANEGVTIIGLGDANERPLISFSTAAGADFEIDGANLTVENFRFDLTGIDALTGPIDVNAAGCTFRKCEFLFADADGQAAVVIVTDANASYFTVDDCVFQGGNFAGANTAIRIVGGNYITIKNSYIDGLFQGSTGGISVTTTAAGFVSIENNIIRNKTAASTAAMDFIQNSTAVVVGNVLGILSGTTPVRVQARADGGVGNGSVLTGRNYYRNTTAIAAGTLL